MSSSNQDYKFKFVSKFEEVDTLISYCKKTGYASFDFETSDLKFYEETSYPTIIGISFQPGGSWIVPLGHKDSPFKENYKEILIKLGKEIFENENITKIAWNIKYDNKWFKRFGIKPRGRLFDAMLAKYLLDEQRPHGLKPAVQRFIPEYGGYELKGSSSDKFDWVNVDLGELSKYCALDCDLTFRLYLFFESRLIEHGFYNVFRNLYMMATRVLTDCEYRGMNVDREYLYKLVKKYDEDIKNLDKEIRNLPVVKKYEIRSKRSIKKKLIKKVQEEIDQLIEEEGYSRKVANREDKIARYIKGEFTTKNELKLLEPLNFASPNQLIEFLFLNKWGLKLPVIAYTINKETKKETDRPSTAEETLLQLRERDKSGFIDLLLKYRGLTKLNSTYVKGMYEKLSSNNRIHASFLLNGTVTNRLSSRDPNFQNIPRDCVSYNTKIITNRGELKIGDLCPKEKGWRTDNRYQVLTHLGYYKPITHFVNKGKKEMFEIEFDDGSILQCTEGHTLYTEYGWKTVKEIVDKDLTVLKYERRGN